MSRWKTPEWQDMFALKFLASYLYNNFISLTV